MTPTRLRRMTSTHLLLCHLLPPLSEIPDRGPYGFEENYSTDTSEKNNNDTSEENDSGTSDTDPYTGYFPCTGPDTDTADENNNDTSEDNDTGTYNTLPYFGPYIFPPVQCRTVKRAMFPRTFAQLQLQLYTSLPTWNKTVDEHEQT